jgi:ferredoxin
MGIKKVWVKPGCISCGSCEFICPAVFKVEVTSQVNQQADHDKHAEDIKEAAKKCPVQVICYKEEEDDSGDQRV